MLNNPFWLQLDGTPTEARPPAALRVLQRPISKAQLAGVQHLYGLFAAQMRLSVAPGQQWERFLPDGTRVLLRSHRGKDEVLVWPADGDKDEHVWFFAPYNRLLTFSNVQKQGSVRRSDRSVRSVQSLDGVLSSWEVVVGTGTVNNAKLSKLARTEKEQATGYTHVKAWSHNGEDKWRYLPGLVDKRNVYLGTYLHGKVSANATTGQTISVTGAAPVVIPGTRQRLMTPNTNLIALPGLPAPKPPTQLLAAPVGLRNKAIVYGTSRMYDTLTNTAIGVGIHPYAPNLHDPLGKRALFIVECAIEGTAPYANLNPGGAASVAGTSYHDYAVVRVRRQNPNKAPKTSVLFAGKLEFVCNARTAWVYFARYVTFSPDGSKVCVAIHMYADWQLAARAHTLQDIRDSLGVAAAWEFTLSGGTQKDWPTSQMRQVVSPSDHKTTTTVVQPKQVYFREASVSEGTSTITAYGPNDEYLNGQSRYYGSQSFAYVDRLTDDFVSVVEEKPLMAEYGKDSTLKVITNRITQQTELTDLKPYTTKPAFVEYDCILGVSWYVRPPDFVESYDYSFEQSIERSILSNGAPVYSAKTTRTYRRGVKGTFTASLTNPPWTATYEYLDYTQPQALPTADSFRTVPLGSNNTFIVLGMARSGDGQNTRLMAVDQVLTTLDVLPKDSTGRYWYSWNPITDEISSGEGTAWC
jgi:hypothetical protein